MAANGGPSQRSMQGHQCIAGQLTRVLSLLSALPSILFTAGRTLWDSSHTIRRFCGLLQPTFVLYAAAMRLDAP